MKLLVSQNKINHNPADFLRRAGYACVHDRLATQESFSIRLGREHYPRLHMYYDDLGEQVSFNLHLDQKRNSYEGSARHSAEYSGEIVEAEISRLRSLLGISDGLNETAAQKNRPIQISKPSGPAAIVKSDIGNGNLLNKISNDHQDDFLELDEHETTPKKWWEFWK